jgi:hypothetical protein
MIVFIVGLIELQILEVVVPFLLRWHGALSASGTIAPAPDEALERCKLTGENRCTKRET